MEIIIPTSLKEITLQKYTKLQKDIKEVTDENLLKIMIVSNICDIDVDICMKLKANDLEDIYTSISNLFKEQPTLVKSFNLNGIEFGFIPNFENITAKEYIDLCEFINTQPHIAMSVLYRPITKRNNELYDIENYKGSDKYGELMKEAPASIYISAMVFFYNLANELLKYTKDFINKELTKEEAMHLELNGVGISQLMQSLEQIELNTIKF